MRNLLKEYWTLQDEKDQIQGGNYHLEAQYC